MTAKAPEFPALKARLSGVRYLMVVPIPWHRDGAGVIWLDPLWARDLVRHMDYLSDLTILAPETPMERGMMALSALPGLKFAHLPEGQSLPGAVAKLPAMIGAAWRALGRADLCHTGAAGWPIPPGLVVNPLAALRGVPMVMTVESAFWRGDGSRRGWGARAKGALIEALARWSARRAVLNVFTHARYGETLAKGARGEVLITPATWLDQSAVLSPERAQALWQERPARMRFALAARLVQAKGIETALEALAQSSGDWQLDIIGEGPLAARISDAARVAPGRLRLLEPVPYGPDFFALLQGYHALLVPSLSDEQPRILYDGFARALPVIASDTAGHAEAVIPGQTGLRFPPGDAAALAGLLDGLEAGALQQMGLRARDWVDGRTHEAMHLARARALARLFGRA